MTSSVCSLELSPTVAQIANVLRETEHNGFPILKGNSKLIGLISRHTLMTIMRELERVPEDHNADHADEEQEELNYTDFI